VAEFVPDEETLAILCEVGADFGQGYYLGRPEPIPDFDCWPLCGTVWRRMETLAAGRALRGPAVFRAASSRAFRCSGKVFCTIPAHSFAMSKLPGGRWTSPSTDFAA